MSQLEEGASLFHMVAKENEHIQVSKNLISGIKQKLIWFLCNLVSGGKLREWKPHSGEGKHNSASLFRWVSFFLLFLVGFFVSSFYFGLVRICTLYNFPLLSISLSTAGITLSFSIYIYLLLQKVHLIYVSTIAQKEGKTFPKLSLPIKLCKNVVAAHRVVAKGNNYAAIISQSFATTKKAIMLR